MAKYEDLIDKNGTIVDKATGKQYPDEKTLAADLGVQVGQVQWGNIAKESAPVPINMPEPISTPVSATAPNPTIDTAKIEPIAKGNLGAVDPAKLYIKYANGNEVFDKATGQHITAEEAAKIPDFWNNVEHSSLTPDTNKGTEAKDIQDGAGQSPVDKLPELSEQKPITEKKYIRENGDYNVYEVNPDGSRGKYISAEEAKAIPDFWNNVKTVEKSVTEKSSDATSDAELATLAAKSGLSLDGFISMMTGKNAPTQDDYDNVKKKLGITSLADQYFTKPVKSTVDLYNEAFAQAGLGDLKKKIDDFNAIVAQKRNDLVKKVGGINDNSWLTESSRLRSVKDAIDLANNDIGNYLKQADEAQRLYDNGINEINGFITRYTKDFETNRNLDKEKLDYLLKTAEEQTAQMKTDKAKEVLRYIPDYLQASAKAKKPDTLKTDKGEFTWNSDTSKFEIIPGTETAPSMTDQYGSGVIGEYNFYAEQEKAAGRKPMSFDAYQTADSNRKAKANTTTIKSETGANFNTRLNEEITSLKNGWYGKEGAREKVINALKVEFPNMDINQIGKYVMARVQDGYEKSIKDKTDGTTMILKDGSMIKF